MSAIDSDDKDREQFVNWKEQWGKVYPTEEEDDRRFETFKQKLRKIEAHNSGPDSAYWRMGLNRFSDLTKEQFKTEFLLCKPTDDITFSKTSSKYPLFNPNDLYKIQQC
ncbi:putative actinidain [Helianthus anomalus]